MLHHRGVQLILAYSWARSAARYVASPGRPTDIDLQLGKVCCKSMLRHQGVQLILAYSWARSAARICCITGASNWYWLTVGQGLLQGYVASPGRPTDICLQLGKVCCKDMLRHWGVQLILAYSWARSAARICRITGSSNWYWLTAGQGLLQGMLHHRGVQLILAYSWARSAARVCCVTGTSNWYWFTVGQGLLQGYVASPGRPTDIGLQLGKACCKGMLRRRGVQLILAYSWARSAARVCCITGASNWYWLTVGQGLLPLQQVGLERNVFISSVSSLSFIFFCQPCASLSTPLYLSFSSVTPVPLFQLLYISHFLLSPLCLSFNSSISLIFFCHPCASLSTPLYLSFSSVTPVPLSQFFYFLFCISSPFLWETTHTDPQGLTCR